MPARLLVSVLPVWLLAVVGAVLVGVLAPATYLETLPLVLTGCVFLTVGVQLALSEKDGLVTRMMASIGGSVVVLAIATAVFAISLSA